jgi:hypothetical protein
MALERSARGYDLPAVMSPSQPSLEPLNMALNQQGRHQAASCSGP